MDRPQEISRFEMLGVAACVINFAAILILRHVATRNIVAAAIGAAISIGLILWTARGRSSLGRLLATGWLGLGIVGGLLSFVWLFVQHVPIPTSPAIGMSIASIALNVAAVTFLWSRAATAWLKGRTAP